MPAQYLFELAFLRLLLKRPLLSDSALRFTLLAPPPVPPSTQELRIKRTQKLVELDALTSFRFAASPGEEFSIRYEIKGNGVERVRSIPIDVAGMVREFESSGKSTFEETYAGENAELAFKFFLSRAEVNPFQLLVSPEPEDQKKSDDLRGSGSISRSKRPPQLNLPNKNGSPPSSRLHTPQRSEPNHMDLPYLKLSAAESYDQKESASVGGLQRKQESLPMAEIERVKELMATHHRPAEQHHEAHGLSYKLKIVIVMLVIGLMFLLYDTLSDRSLKRKGRKKLHGHGGGHGGKKSHKTH